MQTHLLRTKLLILKKKMTLTTLLADKEIETTVRSSVNDYGPISLIYSYYR